MEIKLIVDTRERQLIRELSKINKPIVETLDLGDIIFKKDDEIILIIERKTIQDLKASICDGRGREQKARLLGCGIPNQRIMYLIEGNMDQPLTSKIGGIPVSTLVGSLINTQLRDNLKVYKTSSIHESAEYIRKLHVKLNKDNQQFFREKECISASKYASTLKKKKKANMTPEIWMLSQLSLIPQVTERIAEQIHKLYPNIFQLMQAYTKVPDHLKIKLLSDLTYPLRNGKQRRIGDKVSLRIYKFLYGFQD